MTLLHNPGKPGFYGVGLPWQVISCQPWTRLTLFLLGTFSVLGHFGHGHFGLGRFGPDISAMDISATQIAKGGRFDHYHKLWVWDVCMHKCVMLFLIF